MDLSALCRGDKLVRYKLIDNYLVGDRGREEMARQAGEACGRCVPGTDLREWFTKVIRPLHTLWHSARRLADRQNGQ